LHAAEHVDQADHGPTAQLMGQACVLHACDCDKAGQPAPPYAAARVTVRVCVSTPPPHVLEQVDHADQVLTWQSTGHGCVLHVWVCDKVGHTAPPLATGTVTVRDWVCRPPPHVCEQIDHADHALTTQLTGQGCTLHDRSSTNDGHATPPLADCTVTVRVWRCLPPPHVAEHADHADQSLTTQLTGHACVLHGCEANKVGHAAPP